MPLAPVFRMFEVPEHVVAEGPLVVNRPDALRVNFPEAPVPSWHELPLIGRKAKQLASRN